MKGKFTWEKYYYFALVWLRNETHVIYISKIVQCMDNYDDQAQKKTNNISIKTSEEEVIHEDNIWSGMTTPNNM